MRKPAFCPAFAPPLHEKKPFDVWRDLWSFQNEVISLVAMRSKELWLVQKNRATVKPDSSLTPRWIKLQRKQNWTAKSTNLEENAGKIKSEFLSSEQPCVPKSLSVALKITGVEKIPSENLWLQATQRPFDSSFEWRERKWRWRFLSSVVGDSQISLI